MDFKADALVLRASDWGEYDKIVTLFTAERGKLSAALKGVKRAGAKLKFAAQPFCFGEFVLVEKAGRRTVISASMHDGFYALREDICCFYAAAVVAEACDKLLYEGMVSPELFLAAVRSLEELSALAERANPLQTAKNAPNSPQNAQNAPFEDGKSGSSFVLLKFLLSALKEAGYPVTAQNCPHCGEELFGRMRFDVASGAFGCEACGGGVPASESTYLAIRAAYGEPGGEATADGVKRALRLLSAYFSFQASELPALNEYLRT